MKKITTLLLLFVMTLSQAQLFSSVRTQGGTDTNTATRTVTDWLHYDNGTNSDVFGIDGATHTVGAYIKLTSALLAPHTNRQIEEVKMFLGAGLTSATGNITVEIYSDPNTTPVYTEDFPTAGLTANAWNTVTLSTPFIIDGTEIYIGYKLTTSTYVLGVDDGSNFVPDVNYYILDSNSLTSWDGVATQNFNIQVGVGGNRTNNDASISNVDLNTIIVAGNTNITASISNYGSNNLNSIDFNYQVDNGTVQTDHLTGLNLASGQSTTITHSTPWNAVVGSHSVDVFVSNFNGNGADDIPADDHVVKVVSVASNSTQNIPLYEEFTSSTCSPCANLNSNYFNTSFLSTNSGKFNLIKYQMNWPSPGDPYYTAEGGVRRAFYDVTGVPSLYLDGLDGTHFDSTALQQDLDNAYAESAYFVITSSYTIDSNTKDINVTVDINPYLTGDYTLHCAVVEKTTTGNVGTNGETEFHNVMMKMVPNANGTSASLVAGTPANFNLTANLNGSHIEEYSDLEVVVFLQDDSNQKVMQSTKSTISTSAVSSLIFKNLKIYPNPSTGTFFIDNAQGIQIQIFDLNGSLVYQQKKLISNNNIELDLPNGVYLAKFIKNDKIAVRKIVITK